MPSAERTQWLRGFAIYLWAVVRALSGLKCPHLEVRVDDRSFDGRRLLLHLGMTGQQAAAVLGRAGRPLPVDPAFEIADGIFTKAAGDRAGLQQADVDGRILHLQSQGVRVAFERKL